MVHCFRFTEFNLVLLVVLQLNMLVWDSRDEKLLASVGGDPTALREKFVVEKVGAHPFRVHYGLADWRQQSPERDVGSLNLIAGTAVQLTLSAPATILS